MWFVCEARRVVGLGRCKGARVCGGGREQETGFSEQTRRADGDADSVNAVHQRVPLVVGMEGFQDTVGDEPRLNFFVLVP